MAQDRVSSLGFGTRRPMLAILTRSVVRQNNTIRPLDSPASQLTSLDDVGVEQWLSSEDAHEQQRRRRSRPASVPIPDKQNTATSSRDRPLSAATSCLLESGRDRRSLGRGFLAGAGMRLLLTLIEQRRSEWQVSRPLGNRCRASWAAARFGRKLAHNKS